MSTVYNTIKLFHHHDKLADLISGDVSAPVHIRLKPTNHCNHNCWYCCYRNENLYLSERCDIKDMIPQEKMREIVADFVEMGVKAVTFSGGGEPLIYPHIVETIESLLSGNIQVATLTNGSRLKDAVGQILARGATWVRISMDAANEETYAKNRRVSNNEFPRILKNIEAFAKAKHAGCELGINYIVTKENYSDTYSFIKQMKDLGANHVKISECVVSTEGAENNIYHDHYFNQVKEQIGKAAENLDDSSFKVIDKFHDFDDKFDKSHTSCPYLQFCTIVAADQNIYTCHDKAYTDSGLLGSISEARFKTVWESEALQSLMKKLDPSRDCRHHCAVQGQNLLLLDYIRAHKLHRNFV